MLNVPRTVLITGCSSGGIGAALCLEYHDRGYHVFATARNTINIPTSLADLSNVTTIALDVTSPKSIEEAVLQVGESLDILINNSGVALSAPVLDTDLDVARNMFEVNVLGALAITKAFAPLLVRGKDPVIVNNSSIGGETQLPFNGVYGASKAAGTIMSETLRLEVQPLGIRVVTLISGIVDTRLHLNEAPHGLPATSYYKPLEDWIEGRKRNRNGIAATPVAEYAKSVVQQIENGAKGKTYAGVLSSLMRYVHWWMPGFLWDGRMIHTGPPNWQRTVATAAGRVKEL